MDNYLRANKAFEGHGIPMIPGELVGIVGAAFGIDPATATSPETLRKLERVIRTRARYTAWPSGRNGGTVPFDYSSSGRYSNAYIKQLLPPVDRVGSVDSYDAMTRRCVGSLVCLADLVGRPVQATRRSRRRTSREHPCASRTRSSTRHRRSCTSSRSVGSPRAS